MSLMNNGQALAGNVAAWFSRATSDDYACIPIETTLLLAPLLHVQ